MIYSIALIDVSLISRAGEYIYVEKKELWRSSI
jgi:hypothetical protein